MKKQFLSLVMAVMMVVGFAGFMAPKTAMAADTVGYVQVNRVFASHPDFQSAKAAMGLEQQKAQQEFQSKAGSLDDKGKRELDKTLTERIAKREEELMGPIQKKVVAAIKSVAAKEGVTVVLASETVISGGKDLTNDVIAAIGGSHK